MWPREAGQRKVKGVKRGLVVRLTRSKSASRMWVYNSRRSKTATHSLRRNTELSHAWKAQWVTGTFQAPLYPRSGSDPMIPWKVPRLAWVFPRFWAVQPVRLRLFAPPKGLGSPGQSHSVGTEAILCSFDSSGDDPRLHRVAPLQLRATRICIRSHVPCTSSPLQGSDELQHVTIPRAGQQSAGVVMSRPIRMLMS